MTAHLALTTPQLNVLLEGAGRVPQQWRRRYLDDVADKLLARLMTNGALVDGDVQLAVRSTLNRIGLTQPQQHLQGADHAQNQPRR